MPKLTKKLSDQDGRTDGPTLIYIKASLLKSLTNLKKLSTNWRRNIPQSVKFGCCWTHGADPGIFSGVNFFSSPYFSLYSRVKYSLVAHTQSIKSLSLQGTSGIRQWMKNKCPTIILICQNTTSVGMLYWWKS